MEKKYIINTPCYNVKSTREVEDFLLEKIKEKEGGYTVAINALKILKYNEDEETKRVIDNALIQTPDGAGALLAFNWLLGEKVIKLDLPGLVLEMCDRHSLRLFLLGTTEENNKLAFERIKQDYPGINLVGRYNGFFDKYEEVRDALRTSAPQVVMIS